MALVADKITKAYHRLATDYNFAGYPSCFFDGGYQVLVGGYSGESPYLSRINSSGARSVPQIGLIVSVDYIDADSIRYHFAVANGVAVNNGAIMPGGVTGEVDLLLDSTYNYSAATTDLDNDNLYYMFDFGDGTLTDWIGPFTSAAAAVASHVFSDTGDFSISVKARDVFYLETAWSPTLDVHVRCCIDRGNVDDIVGAGGAVDVADLSYLVDFLFRSGPAPVCAEAGNVDAVLGVGGLYTDVADLSYLVEYLFKAGPVPPPCI